MLDYTKQDLKDIISLIEIKEHQYNKISIDIKSNKSHNFLIGEQKYLLESINSLKAILKNKLC
tara:strand:+ start:396 stop:584 length:189 start_codon:yes stop_codon:yes gene_type:complete